ncbi:signal peptide peptidase SppA [Gemelliphila asaccharolytica]|uniref:Signal peptide peptidase SppA n=2 Tax=Gemelliphila asaccharolytica TaxID=502393 RepID=A0ABR5TN25_9BACL|nr:signal peptide peptidase SppA [Gemella asaccharolytica]
MQNKENNMEKKKRLIALIATAIILILSMTFGKSISNKENKSEEKLDENLYSLIDNSLVLGKKSVVKQGNSSETIQVIKIKGEIGENMTLEDDPYSVINQIKKAKENNNVKAILLEVDSPGGGVYESSEIYNSLLESKKDIYVSMQRMATSGGYYISAPAKKIYANTETITGSIGVIMSSLSAQKFLNDNGIKNQIIRSGNQKAVGGLTEDMPQDTIDIYKEINKETYNRFVDIVAKGRNMDKEKVLSLADGRIYSASQALENGLIDNIGTKKDLIEEIKKESNLTNPTIIEYKKIDPKKNILSSFVKSLSQSIVNEINANANKTITRSYLP